MGFARAQPILRAAYDALDCIIAVLLVASGHAQLLWRLWRISADPVSTIGRDCPNHGSVDHSFAIDGVSYSARNEMIDRINCPNVKIGHPVAQGNRVKRSVTKC